MDFVPDFGSRRSISLEELARMDEPTPIFEHFHVDTDGAHAYVFTVAGKLDGREVAQVDHGLRQVYGCTIGGDVIVIHAPDKEAAGEIAANGLQETVELIRANAGRPAREIIIESGYRART
jgi:hypothetical protein